MKNELLSHTVGSTRELFCAVHRFKGAGVNNKIIKNEVYGYEGANPY
jgi:hypothetical protein